MLRRYAEQILNLYNFVDGMMIVNADARVEYFATYRPDVNRLKEKNLIGKYLSQPNGGNQQHPARPSKR